MANSRAMGSGSVAIPNNIVDAITDGEMKAPTSNAVFDAIKSAYFSGYHTTPANALSPTTGNKVPFTNVIQSSDNGWSATDNDWTVPVDGDYEITVDNLCSNVDGTGYYYMYGYLDGSAILTTFIRTGTSISNRGTGSSATRIVSCTAGQKIDCRPGAHNNLSDGNFQIRLTIKKVS